MKRMLIPILFFILSIPLVSFNYDNYKEMSLNDFIVMIESSIHEDMKGITYFKMFVGFPITVTEYPTADNDKKYISEINYFTNYFKTPSNTFGNVMSIRLAKDYNLILVFQNTIAKYLPTDVQLNEQIGVYCFFGTYNDFDKKIVCMVSSFNTKKDYERRGVTPIWETK